MPADALPLAIFVGRQDELGGVLEGLPELGDDFSFFQGNDVERLEVRFDVDAERRPPLLFAF